jgi:hypothetical protein
MIARFQESMFSTRTPSPHAFIFSARSLVVVLDGLRAYLTPRSEQIAVLLHLFDLHWAAEAGTSA